MTPLVQELFLTELSGPLPKTCAQASQGFKHELGTLRVGTPKIGIFPEHMYTRVGIVTEHMYTRVGIVSEHMYTRVVQYTCTHVCFSTLGLELFQNTCALGLSSTHVHMCVFLQLFQAQRQRHRKHNQPLKQGQPLKKGYPLQTGNP